MIGCSAHALLEWGKRIEMDSRNRPGVPVDVTGRLKAPEHETRELREANKILRKASACFAQAERP